MKEKGATTLRPAKTSELRALRNEDVADLSARLHHLKSQRVKKALVGLIDALADAADHQKKAPDRSRPDR